MAIEAFLINPPKRAGRRTKRKLSTRKRYRPVLYETDPKKWSRSATSISRKRGITINPRRKRKNPLPSGLLSKMIKKYGPKRGMKEAWKSLKSNHPASHVITRRKYRKNPIGEEVILVGANPRRKRRSVSRRRKHKVSRRRRRTSVFAANPAPRRRRRRHTRRNPIVVNAKRSRRSRRSFRRNPVSSEGGINLSKPMTILMPIAVGLAAKMATEKIPALVGMTTGITKYGVQAAVAVGGHLALKKFVGKTNANVWLIVSAVTIAADALKTYLPAVFADELDYDMGAYPQMSYASSAPVAMNGYDSMADSDLGAFPY